MTQEDREKIALAWARVKSAGQLLHEALRLVGEVRAVVGTHGGTPYRLISVEVMLERALATAAEVELYLHRLGEPSGLEPPLLPAPMMVLEIPHFKPEDVLAFKREWDRLQSSGRRMMIVEPGPITRAEFSQRGVTDELRDVLSAPAETDTLTVTVEGPVS